MSHTLQIFKINITFEDFLTLLLRFFDISFSLESAKNHRNRGLHVWRSPCPIIVGKSWILTNIFTASTFYIKWVITEKKERKLHSRQNQNSSKMKIPFFLIWIPIFKQKTIRTKFSFWNPIYALIVKITLFWIWKVTIPLWTIKVSCNSEIFMIR